MDKITQQWLERAEYDLKTAESLFRIKNYLYVAFMCQQSLEKLLKANIASQGKLPPFVHNLLRLAEESNLLEMLSKEHRNLLADMNPYYIKARYGEYKDSLYNICTFAKAKYFLTSTKELFLWLKARIK